MISLLDDFASTLLPASCASCGVRGAAACPDCLSRVRRLRPTVARPPIEWEVSCFAYEGVVREAIARAKYRGYRSALRTFVPDLVAAVADAPGPIDVVTWAPASRSRLAGNGVDHAAYLARAVGRRLHLPVRPLLRRRGTGSQTGHDAAARRRGPVVHAATPLPGPTVLVVDDVTTTGATLHAAARVLTGAGASRVFTATVARTPARGIPASPAYTFRTNRV